MSNAHLDLSTSAVLPFQEEVAVDNYFASANREMVLAEALDSLEKKTSIVILSGDEGSGKTMVCKMLEHKASPSCNVIFFPCTVDSFEDVIRLLAAHLGLELDDIGNRKSVEASQQKICNYLQERSEKILIIFDEAENIYLATLERIRKLIDAFAEAGVEIHVVFSGRPTFLENCEQLSVIDFRYSEEFVSRLEPLSLSETGEYLRKSVESIAEVDADRLFDDKVVKKIYDFTLGNFRAINILGEESLHAPGDDAFLGELLENLQDDARSVTAKAGGRPLPELRKNYSLYPWLGTAAILIVILFSFFNSSDDKQIPKVAIEDSKKEIQEAVVKPVAVEKKTETVSEGDQKTVAGEDPEDAVTKPVIIAEVAKKPAVEDVVESVPAINDVGGEVETEIDAVTENEQPLSVETTTADNINNRDVPEQNLVSAMPDDTARLPLEDGNEIVTEDTQLENPPEVTAIKVQEQGIEPVTVEPVPQKEEVEAAKVEETPKTEVLTPPEELVSISVVSEKDKKNERPVVVFRAVDSTKRKPDFVEELPPSTQVHVQKEATKTLVTKKETEIKKVVEEQAIPETRKPPLTQVQEVIASNAHFTTDQLYQKRLLAGVTWRAGEKDNKYTVQLMVLTSKTAEQNLKTMLTESRYRQEADNFYIFKNHHELETIFVFYGEYPTIAQARQAQNSLPQFLKEHKPYAITIKGAMNKINR